MSLLRDSRDEFLGLVGAASAAMRLPQAFVEKDYWVTELLRSIAQPIDHVTPIFKGGTSLSKVYRLIERFSEDVDVLVQFTALPGVVFGEGRRDKVLKTLCERALTDLGLGEAGRGDSTADKGKRRSVRYIYPIQRPSSAVQPWVLLEIGIRGEPHPRTLRPIRSYMAEYALKDGGANESDFDEFAPVQIHVLNPERTLVEKLSMLHDLAVRYPASQERAPNAARHLYDIVRLLSDTEVRAALEPAPTTTAEMAAATDRISEEFGWSFTPRLTDGYATSPAFEPRHPMHSVLRPAYEHLLETLVYGNRPAYEECLAIVTRHAALL